MINSAVNDPVSLRTQKLAAVVAARCDSGEATGSRTASLQKLIQDNDSSDGDLFSRIYNAQGECLLKMNRHEEAAIAFLHTDLLFANQPEGHAEAALLPDASLGKA